MHGSPKTRQEKPPHGTQEGRLLKTLCRRNVLCLARGECGALLRPRDPLDGRTLTRQGSTRDRPPPSAFGGLNCVWINHEL